VLPCTSLVVFMLLNTQNLFVPSNEINQINVYSNKLVNYLHIITLYKLLNKLICVSSQSNSSWRACRAVLFDKLDTGKMHGLDTTNVSSCVMSRRDEPSGIWAILTNKCITFTRRCVYSSVKRFEFAAITTSSSSSSTTVRQTPTSELPRVLEYSLVSISGCKFHFGLQFFLVSIDELLEFVETWGFAISFATCQPR